MAERNLKPYLLAGLLASAGLAILLYLGLTASSLKVYSVEELLSSLDTGVERPAANEAIQVYGKWLAGEAGSQGGFRLQDRDNPLKTLGIHYSGQMPPGLKNGQDVFLSGTCDPVGPAINVTEIITACPTKYETKRQQD